VDYITKTKGPLTRAFDEQHFELTKCANVIGLNLAVLGTPLSEVNTQRYNSNHPRKDNHTWNGQYCSIQKKLKIHTHS
jgi:hypothetical protein